MANQEDRKGRRNFRKRGLAARKAVMTRKRRAAGRKRAHTAEETACGQPKAVTTRKRRASSNAENARRWYKESWATRRRGHCPEIDGSKTSLGTLEGVDIRIVTNSRRASTTPGGVSGPGIVADDVIAEGARSPSAGMSMQPTRAMASDFPPSIVTILSGDNVLEFKDGRYCPRLGQLEFGWLA